MNRCLSESKFFLKAINSVAAPAYSAWIFSLFISIFGLSGGVFAQLSEPLVVQEAAQAGQVVAARRFPANVQRGVLVVRMAPEVMLNDKIESLSPGARIRDTHNRIITPAVIAGQEVVVNYSRNALAQVHEVWVLTPAEAKVKLKALPNQSNHAFGSSADSGKRDDGRTAFKDLPTFEELGRAQRNR